MDKKKRIKNPRHEALREFHLALPDGAVLPDGLAELGIEIADSTEQTSPSIPSDYPRLRIALRDRGLPFQPAYNQKAAALIIGRTDRTVRDWANTNKIPCNHWPTGRPYFSPQNIEDYLVACERPRKVAR
jgi:hypothetical protein